MSSTSNFNLFNQMFCLLKNEHLQCLDFDYLSILRVKNSNSKKNKFKLISLLNFFIHFFSLSSIFTISRKIPFSFTTWDYVSLEHMLFLVPNCVFSF